MLNNYSINSATINYLARYAFDHNIGVGLIHDLPEYYSSCSDVQKRSIVVNMNAKDAPLQFAHEIGHILNGDEGVLYYTVATNGMTNESNATKTGIRILFDYYFQEVPVEEMNVDNFMTFYKIPSKFRDFVTSLIA